MRKFLFPVVLVVLTLSLFACKKEKGVNENLNPNDTKKYDFMSVKAGSWWKYSGRDSTGYTRYARDRDTVVGGLSYHFYERKDADTSYPNPEFFGKNGSYYITLLDLDGKQVTFVAYAFWRDSAGVGDSWLNTGTVYHPLTGTVNVATTSEVKETGLTMTFSNHTYKNVVHVRSSIKATVANITLGNIDVWFEKGIGMIREEADVNILNVYTAQHIDSLTDYHIVP